MRVILLAMLALTLSGCASISPSSSWVYKHYPPKPKAEMDRETFDCNETAQRGCQVAGAYERCFQGMYQDCMEMKYGYVRESKKTQASTKAIVEAMSKSRQGDTEGAIALLTKALQEDPSDVYAYVFRGGLYGCQKLYDKAIADFDSVIVIEPENAAAYMGRGAVYKETNKYDLAISDYTKAINLSPEYFYSAKSKRFAEVDEKEFISSAFEDRGWAYCQKNDFDNAIADYTRAMDGNTDAKTLETNYYNRARAHWSNAAEALKVRNLELAIGRCSLALKDVEEALKLNPNSTDALSFRTKIYSTRAWMYNKQKKYDKSWADVHSAMSLGYGFDSDLDKTFLSDLKKASGRQE